MIYKGYEINENTYENLCRLLVLNADYKGYSFQELRNEDLEWALENASIVMRYDNHIAQTAGNKGQENIANVTDVHVDDVEELLGRYTAQGR